LLSRVIDVADRVLGGVFQGVICRSSLVSSASLERRLSALDRKGSLVNPSDGGRECRILVQAAASRLARVLPAVGMGAAGWRLISVTFGVVADT
jgi:hypothetical protein